jgi:hypothetical protein
MTEGSTDRDFAFPWDQPSSGSGESRLHLAIAWCLDAPERVGEVACIDGRTMLGRGEATDEDEVPRVAFFRQRPAGFHPCRPLEVRRLSRRQLAVDALGNDELELENVGRCPLLINGTATQRAKVHAGDTITLQNALVLLVVKRPERFTQVQPATSAVTFAFGGPDESGIVGESHAVWRLRDELRFAARSVGHVLLVGESGVGKELAARAVHELSSRAKKPFLSRSAATFPEGLIDAELFGTAKDYPNAGMPQRAGLIGDADGGSLFLDEIGELPESLQARLLRVMDERGEYQRLGDSRVQRADVRIIAATNRSTSELKHDLLARFPIRIRVPGLLERREDIPLLLCHLLRQHLRTDESLRARLCDERGQPRVDPTLAEWVSRHLYTHHLRELGRFVIGALGGSPGSFLAASERLLPDLNLQGEPPDAVEPKPDEILRALAETDSAAEAATRLGLSSRFVLYRLMKRLGMKPEG